MAMTKANIVEEVYKKVGFSKSQAAEIVETVFETMKQVLERGEKLRSSRFPASATSLLGTRKRGSAGTPRRGRRLRSPHGVW
jgi:uncharacterized protein (DUF2267 family)